MELKDLKIDKDANCLLSDVGMNSKEWDAIIVKLYEDWKVKTTWIDTENPPKHSRDVLIKNEEQVGIGCYSPTRGWSISGYSYWTPTHYIEIPKFEQ